MSFVDITLSFMWTCTLLGLRYGLAEAVHAEFTAQGILGETEGYTA